MKMSDARNVYTGELPYFAAVQFEAPLADVKESSCETYLAAYINAAKNASEIGDRKAGAVFGFLAVIAGFHPSFDTPANPYEPLVQWHDKRSYVPSDLTPDDVEALRELAYRASDAALLARANDVIWVLTKDYRVCSAAAENYVKAAENLIAQDGWLPATECYKRALQLASTLGRDKDL